MTISLERVNFVFVSGCLLSAASEPHRLPACSILVVALLDFSRFLADRTNGRAYATVLRLSVRLSVCLSSVCDVMYCG